MLDMRESGSPCELELLTVATYVQPSATQQTGPSSCTLIRIWLAESIEPAAQITRLYVTLQQLDTVACCASVFFLNSIVAWQSIYAAKPAA